MCHAIQIRGGLGIELLQQFRFCRAQPAIRPVFEQNEQRLEFVPARPLLRLKPLEIQNHTRCSRLLSRYPSTAVRRKFSGGTNRSSAPNWCNRRERAPRRWFS